MENIKSFIEKVIDNAFTSITELYNSHDGVVQGTRLCFPEYKNGSNKEKKRLSEQEFKQLFIEKFNELRKLQNLDLYYSVETPTRQTHTVKAKEGSEGRSGNYDLTVRDKEKTLAIIEFKAKNSKYDRDVMKMCNHDEGDALCFLVNVLEASYKNTFESIEKKVKELYKEMKGQKTIHLRMISIQHHVTKKPEKVQKDITPQTI